MKNVEVKLPPGLAPITRSDSPRRPGQTNTMPHTQLKPSKSPQDASHIEPRHFIAADQQHLLDKKGSSIFDVCDTDLQCSGDGQDGTDISNCDNSTNSDGSSLGDAGTESSSPIPITKMESNDVNLQNKQDECSVRYRKPQNPIIDTANNTGATWTKGYVQFQVPDKTDNYSSKSNNFCRDDGLFIFGFILQLHGEMRCS